MSETKVPTECNHCKSKNIIHQVWGRTEFWSCKDCKQEVVYVEPKPLNPWQNFYGLPTQSNLIVDDGSGRINLNDTITTNSPGDYRFHLPTGIIKYKTDPNKRPQDADEELTAAIEAEDLFKLYGDGHD